MESTGGLPCELSVSRKGTKCQGSPQGLPLVHLGRRFYTISMEPDYVTLARTPELILHSYQSDMRAVVRRNIDEQDCLWTQPTTGLKDKNALATARAVNGQPSSGRTGYIVS